MRAVLASTAEVTTAALLSRPAELATARWEMGHTVTAAEAKQLAAVQQLERHLYALYCK